MRTLKNLSRNCIFKKNGRFTTEIEEEMVPDTN